VSHSDKAEHPDPGVLSAGRTRAPRRLVLVRHGESVGNLADAAARAAGLGKLDLSYRDPDTPLSDNGVRQAQALGDHLASLPRGEWPDVVLSSPYVRARTTAEECLKRAGASHTLVIEERLRERDLGMLDGYTGKGIRELFPEEAARRDHVGKFYYRPPGGESWTDVALRIRSVLGDIRAEYPDGHVWVFTHQAVIMAFRLVLEGLEEHSLLTIDAEQPLPNCSLTSYNRDADGGLALEEYAATAHISESEATVTREESAAKERS